MIDAESSSAYIAVRDDATLLSVNEREFVREARTDGRSRHQRRPVRLQLSRDADRAVATVRWGHTRVTAHMSGDLVPPQNPDRPQEGWVVLSVDMSPAASTSYRSAAPLTSGGNNNAADRGGSSSSGGPSVDRFQRQKLNPILRAIERSVQAAIDVEALCVGELVWKLQLSVTILQDDGNCLDAAVLAAIASLRHYRQPAVDANSSPPKINLAKEPIPLPLRVIPLAITFGVVLASDEKSSSSSSKLIFLVDPTHKEELCSKGTFSIAVTVFGELCWLDYAGDELHLEDLKACHDTAFQLLPELGKQVDKALQDADEKALHERMLELQTELPPLPTTIPQVPFFVEAEEAAVVEPTDQEEEEYRRKALDYNLGHIATKIKETSSKTPNRAAARSSQLLQAMLKSVSVVTAAADDVAETTSDDPPPVAKQAEKAKVAPAAHKAQVKDKAGPTTPKPPPAAAPSDDDDEEEEPMQLKSEFQAVASSEPSGAVVDEVDDLAAAIKPKRKKKSSKK
jgi:exosome complex RNA-binding protein Rrp42 (RNase PH superfamily)